MGSDVTAVEVVAITRSERGPWHPMPSCPFGLSRIVYPPSASWLIRLGADGRFGAVVQFVPLLVAVAVAGADLEFEAK